MVFFRRKLLLLFFDTFFDTKYWENKQVLQICDKVAITFKDNPPIPVFYLKKFEPLDRL